MDHYIIFIQNGSFTEEEQQFFNDYLNSILPSQSYFEYSSQFANQISFLLKPSIKHAALLNASNLENINWSGPNEQLNVQDIISQDVKDISCGKDIIQKMSTSLHYLSDQLPAFGTYKLDVILNSNVLKDLSISDEPELAGAFYRLTRWHSAHFTIFMQNELDAHKFNKWYEIMNAHIIKNSDKLDLGPTLWRGSVELQPLNGTEDLFCQGFELRLDLEENHVLNLEYNANKGILQRNSEHTVLSSKLQVIEECSFSTIPSYMVSPMVFRLNLAKPNILNEQSFSFMEYLSNHKELTLLVRLDYSVLSEKPKHGKMYCTSRWKRAITTGYIKDADCSVTSFENHIIFAITASKQSGHIIAYPLRDPRNLDASLYFNIKNQEMVNSFNHIEDETRETRKILSNLPVICTDLFEKILQKEVKLKMNLCKNGIFNVDQNIDFTSIWQCSTSNDAFKQNPLKTCLEEIDPCDWPERIYLLSKQMKVEQEKKSIFPNALASRGPKLPQHCVSLSSEDIRQQFLLSGERKILENLEVICPQSNKSYTTCNVEDVLHSRWPEVLKFLYHDIHYNSSLQAEVTETMGNQMVNCYVKCETASTCNKQQMYHNYSMIIPEKNSSSQTKEFRSPSCRKPINIIDQNVKKKRHKDYTEKNSMVKDLITKKILETCGLSSLENISNKDMEKKNDVLKKTTKPHIVKANAPIRCSPRKKNPVSYKYPPVNNRHTENKNGKINKSNELPDLLRKKLRNAVATALENHGISLTDAFFQPCGKRLFTICQAFIQDLPQKKGKTSERLQKIADAHVKQVIEFERQNRA